GLGPCDPAARAGRRNRADRAAGRAVRRLDRAGRAGDGLPAGDGRIARIRRRLHRRRAIGAPGCAACRGGVAVKRWLPHPLASLLLLAGWLLRVRDASIGQILLGALLGVVGPLAARPLELPSTRPGPLRAWIRLAGRVLADVFVSNLRVARLILGPSRR